VQGVSWSRSCQTLSVLPIFTVTLSTRCWSFFPVAFFFATFLCDLGFWYSGYGVWVIASEWLLGAGLVTAAMAATAGLIDFLGDPRIRAISDAWQHAIGNVSMVLVSLANFYWRYRYGAPAVIPVGLIMSAIVVCMLLFTGWKGGELVFRHRVAVYDEPKA
jgi:uncharacterized membrane protein